MVGVVLFYDIIVKISFYSNLGLKVAEQGIVNNLIVSSTEITWSFRNNNFFILFWSNLKVVMLILMGKKSYKSDSNQLKILCKLCIDNCCSIPGV